MKFEIEFNFLLEILENEGALIVKSSYNDSTLPYKIISPCRNYSVILGDNNLPYDRIIINCILQKLGMQGLIDIIPYRELK